MAKKNNLESSDIWKPLCFAAALVERMYPNFQLFDEVTEGEGAKVFRVALDLVWEYLSTDGAKIDFVKQYDKLEEVTPDTELFDFYGVWPALDACVALSTLLECCAGQDECKPGAFVRLSNATIQTYLEATGVTEDVHEHQLLLDHKAFCDELDQQLDEQNPRKNVVKSVKLFVSSVKVSNIGIDLTS